MSESAEQIRELRRRMALIEGRTASESSRLFETGHAGMDGVLGGGLARGALHEICAAGDEDASAASTFAVVLALKAGGAGATAMWLRTDVAARRSGYLYAPGLVDLGVNPATLVLGLAADDVALLRSAADSVRCAGLGAVIVECWGNPRALGPHRQPPPRAGGGEFGRDALDAADRGGGGAERRRDTLADRRRALGGTGGGRAGPSGVRCRIAAPPGRTRRTGVADGVEP